MKSVKYLADLVSVRNHLSSLINMSGRVAKDKYRAYSQMVGEMDKVFLEGCDQLDLTDPKEDVFGNCESAVREPVLTEVVPVLAKLKKEPQKPLKTAAIKKGVVAASKGQTAPKAKEKAEKAEIKTQTVDGAVIVLQPVDDGVQNVDKEAVEKATSRGSFRRSNP